VTTSFTFDVELRVPISRLPEAIKDVKKIRDLDPPSMCEIYVVFRSIKKSDAYLGPAEDVVTLELLYYRPKEPKTPKWNEDVYEEMEQMVIEKHDISGSSNYCDSSDQLSEMAGLMKESSYMHNLMVNDPRIYMNMMPADALFSVSNTRRDQISAILDQQLGIQQLPVFKRGFEGPGWPLCRKPNGAIF
jgi:hypothetical protein